MRRTVTLGFLLLSSIASAGTFDTPILGGTRTEVGQFPSVVALEVGGGICTGTLITPDWVLTAAHCIQGLAPASIKVHFGTVSMFSDPGVVRTGTMAIAKPGFSLNSLGKNDIGLVKLSAPITDIKPLPVNLDAAKAPIGIKVTMVGYGRTSAGSQAAGVQYTVDQTSISCASYVGSNTDLLCFNQVSGTGKCQGDSGGPSFAMIDGVMTQVGVTSFGDQYCQQFGADTRTDVERGFILQYVPELECDADEDCPGDKMCFNRKCIITPFAPGGLGASCASSTECDSQVCANDGENAYCSSTCTMGLEGACPDGLDCLETGDGTGAGACWPADDGGGCCSATGADALTGFVGFAFLGLVFRRKRRR